MNLKHSWIVLDVTAKVVAKSLFLLDLIILYVASQYKVSMPYADRRSSTYAWYLQTNPTLCLTTMITAVYRTPDIARYYEDFHTISRLWTGNEG
jgi:hypothetical protein